MSDKNSIRLFKNTGMLYIRMFLIMLVNLYMSRVVLNILGVEDFGIYNIVGGVVVLFSFINSALSAATQRFLSFALGQQDLEKLKRTFSMSLTTHISISLVVLLFAETIGLWFLNAKLNIPAERIIAANWVYQFSILTLIIQIIQVPYNASIIAYEKMSFYAYVGFIEAGLKLAIIFLLNFGGFDKLIYYASLISIVAFLTFLVYNIYCTKKFDSCKYYFFWDLNLYKSLLSFSGWSLFGSLANVGSNQGVNILLNLFYGVTVNAAMGIANQVNAALNNFVINFQTAFRPQIVKSYAQKDRDYLMQLIFQTSKFSFFLLYIIALPILLNTEDILQIWLVNVPKYSVEFCQLILIFSLIETISGPLWMSVQATGKIKNYQIIIGSNILSNLFFGYIFLLLGYNPIIIFWIKIIVNLFTLFARVLFLKKMIQLSIKLFLKKVVLRILFVVTISLPLPFLLLYFTSGIWGIFFVTFISLLAVSISIYFVGILSTEQVLIKNFLWKIIRN